jgi:hypothetical protein
MTVFYRPPAARQENFQEKNFVCERIFWQGKSTGEPRHRDAEIAEKEALIHSFTCDSAVHAKAFGRSQVNLRRFFVV